MILRTENQHTWLKQWLSLRSKLVEVWKQKLNHRPKDGDILPMSPSLLQRKKYQSEYCKKEIKCMGCSLSDKACLGVEKSVKHLQHRPNFLSHLFFTNKVSKCQNVCPDKLACTLQSIHQMKITITVFSVRFTKLKIKNVMWINHAFMQYP